MEGIRRVLCEIGPAQWRPVTLLWHCTASALVPHLGYPSSCYHVTWTGPHFNVNVAVFTTVHHLANTFGQYLGTTWTGNSRVSWKAQTC